MNYNYNYTKRIKQFFLISHGLPLITTLIIMLVSQSFIITDPLLVRLLYIGFISPTIAALYIIYNFYNKEEIRDYWHRVIDYKRIPWKWGLFIALFPFCLRFLAALADHLLGFNNFTFFISPSMSIGYALFLIPFGPIPEEIGWRGVVLPDLQKRFEFVSAVVILAGMWCLWHIPMFFIEGSYHNNLGFFTPLFFNYFFQVFFTSIILSVVYFKTNQSILAAIIFHFLGNLMGEALEMSDIALIIETVIRGIIGICFLVIYSKSINIKHAANRTC